MFRKKCWNCGKRFWFRKSLYLHLRSHLTPVVEHTIRSPLWVPLDDRRLKHYEPVKKKHPEDDRHIHWEPREEDSRPMQLEPIAVDPTPEPKWAGSGGSFSGGGASGGWDSPTEPTSSTESSSGDSSSDTSSSDSFSAGTDGTSGGI